MTETGPPGPGTTATATHGPLASVVRRGAAISAITMGFTQTIALLSTVLLARLLSPAEVGLYTAGTVLTGFLLAFSVGGMQVALIQREDDVEDAANTVFWATATAGLLCSLAALAAAPVIGFVFHNELVAAIAVATSGMLLLHSLTQVPDALMQRRFNFARRLVVDPTRAIAYVVVAVALAASGFGVWSMVIGQYASVLVWLIGSWSLGRWRPGRGRPSFRLWRELARFAYPLALGNLVVQIRETAEATIIGRGLGEAALGNYRYGTRIGTLPGMAVFEIGSYVLFPAFSRISTESGRMHAAFLRALRWIWFAAAPVAALVVALGEEAVIIVFGHPWRDAGLFLVAVAGYGLGNALQAVAGEAIKAAGRSALFHWISGIELVLGLGLVVLLLPFGLVGVGLAISVTEIISGIVLLVLAKPIVGYRFGELLRILTPPALAAAIGLVTVLLLLRVFGSPVDLPTVTALSAIVALAFALALSYLATLTVLDRSLVVTLVGKLTARLGMRA